MFCIASERNNDSFLQCTQFFFEFLKKIKLARLVSWVKKPIWLKFFINWFLIKKRVVPQIRTHLRFILFVYLFLLLTKTENKALLSYYFEICRNYPPCIFIIWEEEKNVVLSQLFMLNYLYLSLWCSLETLFSI